MLLMLAPVRGVVAMQCDMASDSTSDHSMMHEMASMVVPDSGDNSVGDETVKNTQDNCCDNGSKCLNDCGMSTSVSLILQSPTYQPTVTHVLVTVALLSSLLTREHTPPFRPPLVIHS